LPERQIYFDWREMLEKEEKNIDAVMVSTPTICTPCRLGGY